MTTTPNPSKLGPRARKVKILATIGPSSRDPDMLRRLVRAGAAATGAAYVDLYRERADDPFAQDPQRLIAADHLHPSDAGYAVWFDEIERQALLPQLLATPGRRIELADLRYTNGFALTWAAVPQAGAAPARPPVARPAVQSDAVAEPARVVSLSSLAVPTST